MKINPKSKSIIILAAIVVIAVLCVAVAAVVLTSPEHITGTPQATPTPTPSPSPSPSPTPIQATEIHLTSNLTTPFYIGDTLHLTAQLNQPTAGITVTLYDFTTSVAVAQTDATGKAEFNRQPINPFDYTVTATIP